MRAGSIISTGIPSSSRKAWTSQGASHPPLWEAHLPLGEVRWGSQPVQLPPPGGATRASRRNRRVRRASARPPRSIPRRRDRGSATPPRCSDDLWCSMRRQHRPRPIESSNRPSTPSAPATISTRRRNDRRRRGVGEEGERDQHKQDASELDRLGARGEERDDQRRHAEVIGVALVQAEMARQIAEPLEDVRGQDRREGDRKGDRADQHQPSGKLVERCGMSERISGDEEAADDRGDKAVVTSVSRFSMKPRIGSP